MRYALPFALLICSSAAMAQPPARPAPLGGWSAVAAPADDANVRAAANAMLAQIPTKHARLRRIETASQQVVAGMNYRLTLRLTDGSRWSAVVWHKLDRTFAVSALSRAR